MGNNDDNIPASYAYAWDAEANDTPLKEFLTKYKPSMVQDDGTKPWLWVRKSAPNKEDGDAAAATKEAKELLEEVTKKVEDIKNDESIPIRGNKKKGTKSKKEVREEVQKEATEKLEEISRKHDFVSGKWLLFGSSEKVDVIWNSVATSLIEGPLSGTSAYMAKVATSPREETSFDQHVMHIYIPDVYDKDHVTQIMKILLRNHGLNLSGVKSNLYTAIGLDSKHPSGVPSTVWKNAALMDDKDMKALKEEYFAELDAKKAADTEKAVVDKSSAPDTSDVKVKPKLKKKAKDDPFASEDEEEKPAPSKKVEKPASKAKKPVSKKAKAVFASDSEGEDSEEEKRTKKLQAKKAPPKAAKRSKPLSSDDEEDERPKKAAKKSAKK